MKNRVRFTVSLVIPEGATVGDVREYIAEAVQVYKGCLNPAYPLTDIDNSSIKVTRQINRVRKS